VVHRIVDELAEQVDLEAAGLETLDVLVSSSNRHELSCPAV
jgi:hypothetical protein